MDAPKHTSGDEPGVERLIGYNNMVRDGRDEFPCPLEPCDQACDADSAPPCPQWSVPSVTKEGAVEALRRYASERGLDPRAAAEAKVTRMKALYLFRYRLETFSERRFTRWTREPYTGDEVEEEEEESVLPPPWDISVEQPALFNVTSKDIHIPGTNVVLDCCWCKNKRKSICHRCHFGKVNCYSCSGKGWSFSHTPMYTNTNHCYICGGTGKKTCVYCNGDSRGEKECPVCRDNKKTKLSITLRVKWTNYQDEELCGDRDVPHAQHMPGQTLMTHSAQRVGALTEFPEPSVIEASQRLIQEHSERYSDTHILQQRQSVELVSLTRVSYSWRGRSYFFDISGADGAAIVEDYPESSCQCCSVM